MKKGSAEDRLMRDLLGNDYNKETLRAQCHKGRMQFRPDFGSFDHQCVTFYIYEGELEEGFYLATIGETIETGRSDSRGYEILQAIVEEATKK